MASRPIRSLAAALASGTSANQGQPAPLTAHVTFLTGGGSLTGTTVDFLEGVTPVLTGTNGEVDGEELAGGKDPHVWVDPENMVALTTAVAETLDAADPAHAADHARGANA